MSSPHEVQSVVRRFLRDALVSSIESGGRVVPLQIQFVLNRRRFWETPFVIRNGHRPGWHLRATERDMAQAPPVLDADLWPPRRDPARDAPGIRMEVTPGHADSFCPGPRRALLPAFNASLIRPPCWPDAASVTERGVL